jgi:hypothetical protein
VTECANIRQQFSAYLDGAVSGATMQGIAAHLESCRPCSTDFLAWRQTHAMLSSIGPAKVPANLALRLRVALSQESVNTAQERFERGKIRWENTIRPFLLQVAAGFASTVVLLGTTGLLIGMFASPEPAQAKDEPLGMATSPRFLYSPFEFADSVGDRDNPVVVQVFINGEGRVYDYKIISGKADAKTRGQLEDTLLFSVFAPAQAFGQPVKGTVLLSFSDVLVQG